jgi:hypothetical protein
MSVKIVDTKDRRGVPNKSIQVDLEPEQASILAEVPPLAYHQGILLLLAHLVDELHTLNLANANAVDRQRAKRT